MCLQQPNIPHPAGERRSNLAATAHRQLSSSEQSIGSQSPAMQKPASSWPQTADVNDLMQDIAHVHLSTAKEFREKTLCKYTSVGYE